MHGCDVYFIFGERCLLSNYGGERIPIEVHVHILAVGNILLLKGIETGENICLYMKTGVKVLYIFNNSKDFNA